MRSIPYVTPSTDRIGIASMTATLRSTSATSSISGSPIMPTPRWSPTESHIT